MDLAAGSSLPEAKIAAASALSSASPLARGPEKARCLVVAGVRPARRSVALDALSESLWSFSAKIKPSPELLAARLALVDRLQAALTPLCEDARIQVIGSTATGFSTAQSDLDLTIEGLPHDAPQPRLVLQDYQEALLQAGFTDVYSVPLARIPVLKLRDASSGIECDISVTSQGDYSHPFKTELLSAYCAIDPRVAPLVVIAKQWAKGRNLGDAKFGTLNSFGHTLLMLQFLQCCEPPLLPRLHYYGNDGAVRTRKELRRLRDAARFVNFGTDNGDDLGPLLYGYFRMYGQDFDWHNDAVSVRCGRPIPKRNDSGTGALLHLPAGAASSFCLAPSLYTSSFISSSARERTSSSSSQQENTQALSGSYPSSSCSSSSSSYPGGAAPTTFSSSSSSSSTVCATSSWSQSAQESLPASDVAGPHASGAPPQQFFFVVEDPYYYEDTTIGRGIYEPIAKLMRSEFARAAGLIEQAIRDAEEHGDELTGSEAQDQKQEAPDASGLKRKRPAAGYGAKEEHSLWSQLCSRVGAHQGVAVIGKERLEDEIERPEKRARRLRREQRYAEWLERVQEEEEDEEEKQQDKTAEADDLGLPKDGEKPTGSALSEAVILQASRPGASFLTSASSV